MMYLRGRHELGFRVIFVSGDPRDRANGGVWVWYSVVAPGEVPTEKPEDLRKSFFTRRKKDAIEFDYGDSGKRRISRRGSRAPAVIRATGARWFRRSFRNAGVIRFERLNIKN
ncbi:MAG: hypothetical protein LBB47_07765 [Spirochaetaceae bacterium]|nr:hypothetical protein [Spirochaetaceae bacterium]